MPIYQFSIDNDPAAYACTQGDDDKILQSFGRAEEHLPHRRRIGVVGEDGRYAQVLLDEGRHAEHPFPRQVHRKFDGAAEEIAVRRADTGADQFEVFSAVCLRFPDLPAEPFYVLFETFFVVLAFENRRDGRFAVDLPFFVHKAVLGVRSAYVDT